MAKAAAGRIGNGRVGDVERMIDEGAVGRVG
jgi:hypothetical protein